LFSYIENLIEEEKVNEKVKIGMDSGFKFALTMIREIKNLNEGSLLKSLYFIHTTLQMASPGSLYGTDKMAFMLD